MERERKIKREKKRGETRGEDEVSPRFFPLFRSLYFSFALHYLNAWNRLMACSKNGLKKISKFGQNNDPFCDQYL